MYLFIVLIVCDTYNILIILWLYEKDKYRIIGIILGSLSIVDISVDYHIIAQQQLLFLAACCPPFPDIADYLLFLIAYSSLASLSYSSCSLRCNSLVKTCTFFSL